MAMYIFTYNKQDDSFPERYRVIGLEDDAEFLRKHEGLTGTVLDTDAIEFIEKLSSRYQSNQTMITEMVDAPSWRFVERRFNPAKAEAATNEENVSKYKL